MAPRPVEFTREALEDIEDLPEIARQLSLAAECGRIACGQSDPCILELVVEASGSSARELNNQRLRVLYRLEDHLIVVLGAEGAWLTH